MEDFSLNLLCRGPLHLLPATLDSLKPQEGSFEILLLDGDGSGRVQALASRYQGLNIRIESVPKMSLSQMMNAGVALSKGKYIQFLQPGERYISQYGLSHLTELIQQKPPFISAKGVSQDTHSHWFLRSKVQSLGGFDEHLSFSPMLDLLCRFEKLGIQPALCARVLIDSPKQAGGSLIETCKVLYRYFGLKHTVKWLVRGYASPLKRVLSFFKEAFWKTS